MGAFLKDFDSYGYKKIKCEELLCEYASVAGEAIEVVALRLADVLGPYDESLRLWKYTTWIKAHFRLPTRLSAEEEDLVRTRRLYYEVPKDQEQKLSFTFSVDVVKFVLSYMEMSSIGQTFTTVNLAC